jgi:hypothetical protein
VQGVLLQFSELSSFIFCFELMVCIYLSVVSNQGDLHRFKNRFLYIGYGVPLVVSVLPLIGGHYGSLGYSCGFSEHDTSNIVITETEASIFFYIPLWTFNIANIILIYKVSHFIGALRNSTDTSTVEVQQDQEIRLSQQIIMNMVAYPIIMIACWMGFTIYQLGRLCGFDVTWLDGPRFVMIDLIGFFNAIAYIINHLLFRKLQECIAQENNK